MSALTAREGRGAHEGAVGSQGVLVQVTSLAGDAITAQGAVGSLGVAEHDPALTVGTGIAGGHVGAGGQHVAGGNHALLNRLGTPGGGHCAARAVAAEVQAAAGGRQACVSRGGGVAGAEGPQWHSEAAHSDRQSRWHAQS